MSDTDPYADPSAPAVEEARTVTTPVEAPTEEAPVEAQEAPVSEELTAPEGSIKDVLAWVGDDRTKAQVALDAETAGDKRKTLIKELSEVLKK